MTTPTEVVPSCKGMAQTQPVRSGERTLSKAAFDTRVDGGLTTESLEVGGVAPVSSLIIDLRLLPVAVRGGIAETFTDDTILEVLGGDQTLTTGSIDEVVELDVTRASVLGFPVDGNGAALDTIVELDALDTGVLEHLGAHLGGVVDEQFITFGTDDVPGGGTKMPEISNCGIRMINLGVPILILNDISTHSSL